MPVVFSPNRNTAECQISSQVDQEKCLCWDLCTSAGRWAGHALGGLLSSLLSGWSQESRCGLPAPLYHCLASVGGCMVMALHGTSCIFSSPSFEGKAVLEAVSREKWEPLLLRSSSGPRGSASSLAPPARTLLVLFLPTMGEADLLLHSIAQAFRELKSAFSAVLGSVSPFSQN